MKNQKTKKVKKQRQEEEIDEFDELEVVEEEIKQKKNKVEKKKNKKAEDEADLKALEEAETKPKEKGGKKVVKHHIAENLVGSDDEAEDGDEDVYEKAVAQDEEELLNVVDEDEEDDTNLVDVAHMNVDMNELNLKIQNTVDILTNFKEKKNPNKSRKEYMVDFKKFVMIYYDYNSDLADLIINLFPPNEVIFILN